VIGGRGEKRTLRLVARFAAMWDALFTEDDAGEWRRLREVMWAHCQDVGRDPAEISCSSHLRIAPDPDPAEVAARAARMFEEGIDVVILGLGASHDGATVERLAGALTDVN
jgi:alkanesulfonate monooxygenase SsuD/methylene tetrahydromethanopterin reductase-like flavin-dependent oxidoreductase (luciferase family)